MIPRHDIYEFFANRIGQHNLCALMDIEGMVDLVEEISSRVLISRCSPVTMTVNNSSNCRLIVTHEDKDRIRIEQEPIRWNAEFHTF